MAHSKLLSFKVLAAAVTFGLSMEPQCEGKQQIFPNQTGS